MAKHHLNSVITRLEQERKQLASQLGALDQALRALRQLGSGRPTRQISAAGRRRIAAAQRARWAKIKKAKKSLKP